MLSVISLHTNDARPHLFSRIAFLGLTFTLPACRLMLSPNRQHQSDIHRI